MEICFGDTGEKMTWSSSDPENWTFFRDFAPPVKYSVGDEESTRLPSHFLPVTDELDIMLARHFPEARAILKEARASGEATIIKKQDLFRWNVETGGPPPLQKKISFFGTRFGCLVRHAIWSDGTGEKQKERVVVYARGGPFIF